MKLADLEHRIVNCINPLTGYQEQQATQQILNPAGMLTANESLAVYRNNITGSRVRALQAIYPVCESVLGGACFRALARGFAWRTADVSADLNVYGDQFPEFLAEQQGIEFLQLPYLKELALLEWYWHASYYAADNEPFNYEAFSDTVELPDRLCFILADGIALLKTKYPVREIWQRHSARENTDSVPGLDDREHLCIYRMGFEPKLMQVDSATYSLLVHIQEGYTFKQLGDTDELDDSLAVLLPDLIQRGWVSGFRINP